MRIPGNIDVLVVGAGPTGLMLANQLGRRDVRTLIIDRNAGPSVRTKALGVQARTLEIYSHLGIAERALELGTRATGATLWAEGRRAAHVPLGDIGRDLSPYPFLLILGQDDNERLLGEILRARGNDVLWNTELVGMAQRTDHVLATLQRADGSRIRHKASDVGSKLRRFFHDFHLHSTASTRHCSLYSWRRPSRSAPRISGYASNR